MYDINLICTRHEESGNCNSLELYRIIEKIRPEVIFEELSCSNFNESYEQKKLITLETNAIKEYLKNCKVEHIPVDTHPLPNTYYEDLDRMYNKILNSRLIDESLVLRNLLDNQITLISHKGFGFLNSDENDKYFEQFNFLKEKILNILNDENLFRIHRLEMEMIEKREYQIIKNIYNYSRENSYNTGLMFIGAGHRKSIFKLIKEVEIQERVKLNWIRYIA